MCIWKPARSALCFNFTNKKANNSRGREIKNRQETTETYNESEEYKYIYVVYDRKTICQ